MIEGEHRVKAFCGIDRAEDHHDVAVVDQAGLLLAKRRIDDSAEGFEELLKLLADVGEDPGDPIPVAIETPRGLLVAALRSTGRKVFAINPMAVARYRERHSVARKKSDHIDAMTLAGILRTDAHAHRPLPDDSDLAKAIAVLARAHQDAIWRRTRASNMLRSLLREYFPAFLAAFAGDRSTNLAGRDARAVLALALTPTAAARLSRTRIAAALRRAGRQRGIDELARRVQQALRRPHLHQPPLVEDAMGVQARALLAVLDAECDNVDRLGQAVAETFAQHPDYEIITSFPGLGDELGARLLAEIGDDRGWFADARALKAYAGSAPVTRASGRSVSITRRSIKNNRLAATGFRWAFCAAAKTGPPRSHYQQRRDHGDRHAAALRNLFNRMLGQLHHCLQTRQHYDPAKAFTPPVTAAA